MSVTVAVGSFSDATGNLNASASNTQSVIVDTSAPTVTIAGVPDAFTSQSVFTVAITFSEAVTGFQAADVVLQNATLVALAGTGASYTAQIRSSGAGDLLVMVPADAAADAAGNGNQASAAATAQNQTVEETQQKIATFLSTRATQLLSNQPGLVCHLQGSCGPGSIDIGVTRGALTFGAQSRPGRSVWFQIGGSRTTDGPSKSDYIFGTVGTHRRIGENTIAGVMLQFDHISQHDGASSIDGTGWLFGPYFATKHPNQALFVEGRILWGRTKNTIKPFGTYADSFKTDRWLAHLGVSGNIDFGNVVLTPSISGAYTTDVQKAYIDTLGNLIPQQGVEIGQLSLGLDFQTTAKINGHPWEVTGGVSAVYSNSSGSGAATATVPSINGTRARIKLAAATEFRSGARLQIGTYYDGIGADGFESLGLDIGFQWDF